MYMRQAHGYESWTLSEIPPRPLIKGGTGECGTRDIRAEAGGVRSKDRHGVGALKISALTIDRSYGKGAMEAARAPACASHADR